MGDKVFLGGALTSGSRRACGLVTQGTANGSWAPGVLHEFGALPLWTPASFALLNVSSFIAQEVSNVGRTLVTSELAEVLALAEIASVPLACASEIRPQGAANTLRPLRKC